MDWKLVLNLHIFCLVKVLCKLSSFKCLSPKEQKEHVKVHHPQDLDVLDRSVLVVSCCTHAHPWLLVSRNDLCLEESYLFQVAHLFALKYILELLYQSQSFSFSLNFNQVKAQVQSCFLFNSIRWSLACLQSSFPSGQRISSQTASHAARWVHPQRCLLSLLHDRTYSPDGLSWPTQETQSLTWAWPSVPQSHSAPSRSSSQRTCWFYQYHSLTLFTRYARLHRS